MHTRVDEDVQRLDGHVGCDVGGGGDEVRRGNLCAEALMSSTVIVDQIRVDYRVTMD